MSPSIPAFPVTTTPICPAWCDVDHATDPLPDYRRHAVTVWAGDVGLAVGLERRDWDHENPAQRPAWDIGTPCVWVDTECLAVTNNVGDLVLSDLTRQQGAALGAALQSASLILGATASRS